MKHRPIAVAFASVVTVACTLASSGIGMAKATTTNGARASTVHRSVAGQHAATDGLAIADALRAKIGGLGVRPDKSAGLGVLTGVVDGAGGRPVTGACVIATGRTAGAMAMTGPDGRYFLTSLRPGSYTLHYTDCADPGRYLDRWSGGASWPAGAASVTVAAGLVKGLATVTLRAALPTANSPATVGAADAAGLTPAEVAAAGLSPAQARAMLSPATPVSGSARGAISGLVTGDGKPVKGICVYAFGSSGLGSAKSSKTGRYRIGRLRPGRYQVRFLGAPFCDSNTNWLPQWYPGVNSFFPPLKPVYVRVAAGRTTSGIDAALKLGGEIHGTARSKSGKKLSGVCIEVQPTGKVRFPFLFFFGSARSGRDGSYAAHALFPAKYVVYFALGCGNRGNYAPQWWRDSATRGHATPIRIKGGEVVGHVDAALPPGATVSGVVKAFSGKPLSGICVFAASPTAPFATATTAKDGRYKLIAMATGSYRIYYSLCRNRGNYLPQTRSLKVRTGQNITRFNALLQPGAIVSGTVTDSHGQPVRGICVQVQGPGYGGATTGADGTYSINALPSGSYNVQFSGGCGNAGSYSMQLYNGQTNGAAADSVPLIAGQTTAGINATMQPGGTITGVVTDNTGGKLSNVCVRLASQAQAQTGLYFFGGSYAYTKNGVFTASNLAPGLYAVDFGCGIGYRKLASQWFMSQPDAGTANLVSAAPGAITSHINASLQPGGTITGTVSDHAGKALGQICVRAIPAGSQYPTLGFLFGPGISVTGGKGRYSIGDLAPGKYDLQFSECGRRIYASQWYSGKATEQASTPVTVRSGVTTSGINTVMVLGGSISGLVVSRPRSPLAGICVTAQDVATESAGTAETGRTGRYVITGLSKGAYQVTFADCSHYPTRWGSLTKAGAVMVTGRNAVTGVNQRLSASGAISGTVDASWSARELTAACVVVVPASPVGSYGTALTGADGTYQVSGLSAGKYLVYFGDPFCPSDNLIPGPFGLFFADTNLAPQWYNNQPAQSTATQVTVKVATNSIGIDASLALDGGISGTVTDASHAPVAGECVTAVPVDPEPGPLSGQTLDNAIAVTASDGGYALVDLLPGHYKVRFSTGCGDSGFATQWWHNAPSAHTATAITVSASATVTGINAALQH
ncbi:MAG: carboxypeptidase regulatory-like domain-containing protein [Streptosporangiaceae bacterium]